MTAQNATPRSVQLSLVVEQIRIKYRNKKTPIRRIQLSSLSKDLGKWGDVAIYDNKELRHIVATSIAHRLGLNTRYVKDRLDQINRIACYDETPDSDGVEG